VLGYSRSGNDMGHSKEFLIAIRLLRDTIRYCTYVVLRMAIDSSWDRSWKSKSFGFFFQPFPVANFPASDKLKVSSGNLGRDWTSFPGFKSLKPAVKRW